MKNSTIRYIVVLATLCIVGITITQGYWVKRAFDLKENEFNRQVNTALLNVAEQIFSMSNTPSPALNPVKQLSTNYFVVMVNSQIDASILEFLLRTEFDKRNIKANFEYGIYDCISEKMVYGNYVPMTEISKKTESKKTLPQWANQGYYFGVQFANREGNFSTKWAYGFFHRWYLCSLLFFLVIRCLSSLNKSDCLRSKKISLTT